MDKKGIKIKSELSSHKYSKQNKRKMTKNSSAKTPKRLESLNDRESVHLSKFKTAHIKSYLPSTHCN